MRFVVIGGVSAVLQGVPVTTFDLNLVLDHEEDNLDRAFTVLGELDSCYRDHLPKRLTPVRSDLESSVAMLLMTKMGPLDLLGEVATGWGYEQLKARSRVESLPDGLELSLLDLSSLIEIKEAVGREKDLAALPIYRRALRERNETD